MKLPSPLSYATVPLFVSPCLPVPHARPGPCMWRRLAHITHPTSKHCHQSTMESSTEAAAGKENVGSAAANPVRRGVGPRSGTKKSTPLPRAPTPTPSRAAPNSSSKPSRAIAPAARRLSSRMKAHAPKPGGIDNAPPSGEAATRSGPGASDKIRPQQKQRRQSKPAMLSSASSVPLSGVSSAKGTGGERGGGRANRRSIGGGGGGATRHAKQPQRRGVMTSKDAKKRPTKVNEKRDKAGPRKPGRLTNDDPLLQLSRQGRSDFDFDLTDDEIDDSSSSGERADNGQEQRSEGTSRRKSAAPRAARAGRKRARDGSAGEKNTRPKQAHKSSNGGGRNQQEQDPTRHTAAPLDSGRKTTTTSNARRISIPAAHPVGSSPRSASSASGGDDEALSPRGSWHLGTLFGESDDDDDDDDDCEKGDPGMCNWRLSDDENEDEIDLPTRKQRRSTGSSGAVGGGNKKRRASGGEDGRRGVDGRSGTKKRPSTGSGGGGGGGGGDDDGGGEGGDEAIKSGWADGLPPPAFIGGGRDSSGGSGSHSAGDQAVLEALKAQFKKVDSHELNISS